MIKINIEDHKNVRKNSLPIYYDGLINDPLKLSKRISEKLESHLIAIYEISKTENIVTNSSIAQYLDFITFNETCHPPVFKSNIKEIVIYDECETYCVIFAHL